MPTIDTLVEDIERLLTQTQEGKSSVLSEDVLGKFGGAIALHAHDLTQERRERKPNTIYYSEIGQACARKLWYGVHKPQEGEALRANTLNKFFYGNVLEESVLLLAEAAGHNVQDRQKPRVMTSSEWRISGRLDAVIDGVLVDVKSCSPYSFKSIVNGELEKEDHFGYLTQLSLYNGVFIPGWGRQGFLLVDKQNGDIAFKDYPWRPSNQLLSDRMAALSSTTPPPRHGPGVPDGTSGNRKLPVICSYCKFKQMCWEDANDGAGLKAYAYSTGPRFLTTVKRVPNVPEIDLKQAA